RPSSQSDARALDFVERSGAVKRSLLRYANGRWKLDTAPESWSSCEELIMNQPALLHAACRDWLANEVPLDYGSAAPVAPGASIAAAPLAVAEDEFEPSEPVRMAPLQPQQPMQQLPPQQPQQAAQPEQFSSAEFANRMASPIGALPLDVRAQR